MFDRRADPLALDAIDVTNCDSRCEIRILAKVLKIPPIHRSAIDIDARSQQEMNSFSSSIAPNLCSDSLCQFRIPRRRQSDSTCHRRCWSIITNTKRSIGHLQAWQDQTWYVPNIKSIDTAQQVDLLFQSQLAEDRFNSSLDVVLGRSRSLSEDLSNYDQEDE